MSPIASPWARAIATRVWPPVAMMEPAPTKISANVPTNSTTLFFNQFCSTTISLACGSRIRRLSFRKAAGCNVPLIFYEEACSTSVGRDSGATCAKADGQGKTPSQVRVDLTPEVDRALQDQRLDTAHRAGEIADQVVAVGLRHGVAIQVARLDEVIILRVQRVGVADHLTRLYKPGRIALAGIGLRSTVAVGCIHRQGVPV